MHRLLQEKLHHHTVSTGCRPIYSRCSFRKKVWNRYSFNYVDKVDTSFQFIGRSFSNVGLKIASFLADLWNGSLFPIYIPSVGFQKNFRPVTQWKFLEEWALSYVLKVFVFLYVLVWHSVLEFTLSSNNHQSNSLIYQTVNFCSNEEIFDSFFANRSWKLSFFQKLTSNFSPLHSNHVQQKVFFVMASGTVSKLSYFSN